MATMNMDVRRAIFESNVKLWQIANRLGVAEATITRWMRTELPPEKKERIFAIIEELKVENA